jgi:hypothetical protein
MNIKITKFSTTKQMCDRNNICAHKYGTSWSTELQTEDWYMLLNVATCLVSASFNGSAATQLHNVTYSSQPPTLVSQRKFNNEQRLHFSLKGKFPRSIVNSCQRTTRSVTCQGIHMEKGKNRR